MKKRSHLLFLKDILESMEKIESYISGMDYEKFEGNKMVFDAVLRNLEVIGEAAKNVPADVRKKHSDIPWKRIVGLRNVTIHEYFGVDSSIIWEIIKKNLPDTREKIRRIIRETEKE